jgi:hypothetical protein
MREVNWGTPSRSPHYVAPRRVAPLILASLGAGGGALALLLLLDALGFGRPLSPGSVSSEHMLYDARCEECHIPFSGAADVRCQRCHDPASAGRLTNSAHVFFGSLDPARAAAAPQVACARCHVEHRGSRAELASVEQEHCTDCHSDPEELGESAFSRFASHSEFDVLAGDQRQTTGLVYSHLTHSTGKGGKQAYLLKDRPNLTAPADTCGECHRLDPGGADFEPVSYAAHCEACHRSDVGRMDPVASSEIRTFSELELELDEETLRRWSVRQADFEDLGGEVLKVAVSHRDAWVEHNTLELWRALDPVAFAAERARLQGRASRLERRLALASPTALADEAELAERARILETEIAYLDRRLEAQQSASDPASGVARLEELARAARGAGSDDARAAAEALARAGAALRSQGVTASPLSRSDFEARRGELEAVLDAIEKAAPERAAQVAELRRRAEQLVPGETTAAVLGRAREQRIETLRRVRDELRLRESGTPPPSETLLAAERQSIAAALAETLRRLGDLERVSEPPGTLGPGAIARKQDALLALTKGCRYCHEISPLGAMTAVAAAEPVLWRATFTHRDHLTQGESCASCHAGGEGEGAWSIETSGDSSELNFRGVASCRECHRSGRAADDCQKCHDYHPPATP